jgi:transcriptional regulator with GAF, ATPase, and Fis domain
MEKPVIKNELFHIASSKFNAISFYNSMLDKNLKRKSELFGHIKGIFTGAYRGCEG